MKDYYNILEVEPIATTEQIEAQYLFLTHAWHPDNFPSAELKARAEEKIGEVSEAYRVLSDPPRRAIYDASRHFSFAPAASTPQSRSHSAHEHPQGPSRRRCENCGIPAETKYVEFYENVGLLVIRKHRSVKGSLCKPCIDFYFWNLTGRTMLLGWWGVISLFLTPFILLNNLLRFMFTVGMQKPRLQIAPGPSPVWLFSTSGGFLLLGYYLFSIVSFVPAPLAYTYSPTAVSLSSSAAIVAPTHIPARVDTPALAIDCLPWSEVSPALIGETACVYGDVDRTRNVGESTFQVLFTDDPSAFFLAAGSYSYEVDSGDCVAAEGKISRSAAGVPYIDINEALYQCEPWME